MTSLTRIVLVRHGDVPGIAPPAFRGRTDLKLTARGIRQAEASRDRLASSFQFDSVYTSPLSRCVRTGDIIAEPHRPTPASLAGLTDIDYGAWQGRTYEADQPAHFEAWLAAPHLAAIPGGETLYDVGARAASVLRHVLDRHSGETILLVGHDSVNRVLLLLTLELPLSRYWRIKQDPCGINVLEHDTAKGWTAERINETAHLVGIAE
jgi:phosphoserine phosphatase